MKSGKCTIAFTAPEMVCGEQYNNKIDIWALGVTLYNMTARELPVCIVLNIACLLWMFSIFIFQSIPRCVMSYDQLIWFLSINI